MRRIARPALSSRTAKFLSARTSSVAAAPDQKAEAERLFRLKQSRAFKEIRDRLEKMASGLRRCMYCEDSAGTDIDHFWPKSDFPGRAFEWANYFLACSHCNSNEKRNQFPLDTAGAPALEGVP